MIFYVDITPEEFENIESHVVHDAIVELLRAHRRGRHLLVLNRGCANWLLGRLDFSPRDVAALRRVALEFTQTGGLIGRAAKFVKLVAQRQPVSSSDRCYIISICDVHLDFLLDRTVLITENSGTDGEIYWLILKENARRLGIGRICLEHRSGGGSSIEEEFGRCLRERRISVIFVDSDRDAPREEPTRKERRLRKLADEARWPLAQIVCPDCREVENLLPIDVVAALTCSVEKQGSISILRAIILREGTERDEGGYGSYWRYFDIKNGVDAGRLLRIRNDADRKWVEKKLRLVGVQEIEGFGVRVIHALLADGARIAEFCKHVVQKDWWNEFEEYFDDTIWFCVAAVGFVT